MNKVLAAMIAGLFAAGAYAQGTSQEAAPPTNTKPQQRAEMKKDARPQGQVKAPAGDQAKVAEGSGGVTQTAADKAAVERRNSRDMRRANPDGSKKTVPPIGATPK